MSSDVQLFSLPFLKPWWQKTKLVIRRLFEANTVDRLRRRLHILSQCGIPHIQRDPFVNLCTYLEDNIPLADQIHFLEKIFPTILYMVLNLEDHPEEWTTLYYLSRNRGAEMIVRRTTLASLLSMSFLCLLPQQTLHHQSCNFEHLFLNLHTETAREKLKCFINYFDVLCQQIPNNQYLGAVKITRRVLPGWCSWSKENLDSTNCELATLQICRDSKVEDYPSDTLKVGQFSRQIGYQVWGPSCTPEDVLMCRSPEILGCAFLCESMADAEALEFSGCSVFSYTKGVSSSFEFVSSAVSSTGSAKINYSNLCAIDAMDFQGIPIESQFSEECLLREINKCYIGLLPQSKLPQRRIKIGALSRFASKLSSSIFNEAKLQAQTLQFRQKADSRRKAAEVFADTVMTTLVKGLPVSLKQRMPLQPHVSSMKTTEGVTFTLTSAEDSANTIFGTSQRNSADSSGDDSQVILLRSKALEDFSELFVSNMLKLVADQLFPRATTRHFISKRRRSSSRTISLSQSFSLYDIVKGNEEGGLGPESGAVGTGGLLKPANHVGNRVEEHSNFFLGDIEEVSADFVTDTSDWSSRGSAKYKSKLPLSKSVAAETFFRGRKFASIRDQYSNIVATQILAEAIASYINTLAKKNSSTTSSLSPRLESSLSEDARRESGIRTVDDYCEFLSDRILSEVLHTLGVKRMSKSSINMHGPRFFASGYEDLDYDSYSLHSHQISTKNALSVTSSVQRKRSSASIRRASNATVSSHTMNERLYSFFIIALFFKVWSLFACMTQSFTTHYKRSDVRRGSNVSAIYSDSQEVQNPRNNSKRPSLDLSVDEFGNQIVTTSSKKLRAISMSKMESTHSSAPLKLDASGDAVNNFSTVSKASFVATSSFHSSRRQILAETKSLGSSFSVNTMSQSNNESQLDLILEDSPSRLDLTTVATQTFGSVSFGGDAQFKFFILWISASLAGLDQVYFHPCANSWLNELEKIVDIVRENGATVCDLFELLLRYCNYIDLFKSYDSNKQPKSFFTFIENFYN